MADSAIPESAPVSCIPSDVDETPEEGMARCLSRGEYRATVFHLDALIRLNELGLLQKLKQISSVSGGAALDLRWKDLDIQNGIIAPVRTLVAGYFQVSTPDLFDSSGSVADEKKS